MHAALRNFLSPADKALARFWTVVMVFALSVMMVGALAQVIMRTGWGGSWAPSSEIIAHSFTFATFSGAALLFRGRHHLAIDFFVERLPGRSRHVAAWVGDALVLATCIWLACLSIGMIQSGTHQFSPTMGFSLAWIYLVVPLSFVSCALFVVLHGFRDATEVSGSDEDGRASGLTE